MSELRWPDDVWGHTHTVDDDGYCDECGWSEGDDEEPGAAS